MMKTIDENGVSISIKRGLIIFYIICVAVIILDAYLSSTDGGCYGIDCRGSFFDNLLDGKFSIVGTLIGWFWIGPYLAREAGDLHRSKNFAFVWGALFSVIGAIPYLIYFWVVGDAE
jgi:hypothetical protein